MTASQFLGCYLLLINALGLAFMFLDKRLAKKQRRRVPEATLLWIAALGGSVGSLLGMRLARHKTKHPKFYLGIPILLALQMILAIVLYWELKL